MKDNMKIYRYKEFDYIVRTPESFSKDKKYPVIIGLHGAGGRGRDTDVLATNPMFGETEKHNLDAVFVAPQCYVNSWFDIFEQLQDFVKFIVKSDFCDANKVYLMGASMGGYGTWQLAMTMPEYFAAIVPICGGGMYWNAGRLKNVPVWAFHGAKDPTVFCEESKKMVNAVNNCGGNAKLTIYDDVEHNSWIGAYNTKEMFDWLLSKTLSGSDAPLKDKYDNVKQYG